MNKEKQPSRPPRMTRTSSKESSTGLLMSVIRSLTTSRDLVERDREKENVQRQFQESDARLDKLVQQHHSELTSVMSAFSKVSAGLDSAQNRLKGVREKLVMCQSLLDCKRDELKRLWVESIETRHVMELLHLVEEQAKQPDKIAELIRKKHYLAATKGVIASLDVLDDRLHGVSALDDVRADLVAKKDELFTLFLDDLHKHVYIRSTVGVVKKQRKQADGDKKLLVDSRGVSVAEILSNPALRASLDSAIVSQSSDDPNDINEDSPDDPEADSRRFLIIIIKCLHLLNKIPEAVTAIRERSDKELSGIIRRTGRELLDSHAPSATTRGRMVNVQGNSIPDHLLQEYIDSLLVQFRCVTDMHETIILTTLRRVTGDDNPDAFYTMAELWSKIQAMLEVVADRHTEYYKSKSDDAANAAETDISVYFMRKKPDVGSSSNESRHMFRFDLSQPAMIFNEYLEEQQN